MASLRERIQALGIGGPTALAALADVEGFEVSKVQRSPKLISKANAARIESSLADLELLATAAKDAQTSGIPFSVNYRDVPNLRKLIKLARDTQAEHEAGQTAEQGSRQAAESLLAALVR